MLHTVAKMELLRDLLLFTYFLTVSPEPADVTTTCSAPPAYLGEQGSVTCYFQDDAKAKKFSFNIRRADRIDFDYNRDTVLDCDWINGKQECMIIKEGFVYDYQVTRNLTIIISNVTLEHQGLYSCKLFDEAQRPNIQSCNLIVLEREEPNVNSSEGVPEEKPEQPSTHEPQSETLVKEGGINIIYIIVPTVIGAVLVFAAVVVVYMFKRKDVDNSDSEVSENGGEEINDKSRILENPTPADETPAENPTPADETPLTLTNLSEGHYEKVTFEVANEPSSRPPETGAKSKKKERYDYAKVDLKKKREDRAKANKKKKQEDKVNKKKKKGTTAVEHHEPETDQEQERQPLTNGNSVASPGSKNPDDIEEEAADRRYPSYDDPWGENGNEYDRERKDDDDARHSDTEGREYTEKDMDISDDERLQRGDAPEKVEHKKKFKVVVKDLDAHFATGSDILHPKRHVTA